MKKILGILTALIVSGFGVAWGADIAPTPYVAKAPPVPNCTIQLCTGWYIGGDIIESGANLNIAAVGLSGLQASTFEMGGHVGYEFWNGQWMLAEEVGGDYGINGSIGNNAVVQAGTAVGLGNGNTGLWDAYALTKIGYSLSGLFPLATTGNATPTLPASLANALMTPYAIVGIWDRPWGAGFASGAGVQALLANNWTLSADWIYVTYNNANINTNISEQNESIVRASIDYHY